MVGVILYLVASFLFPFVAILHLFVTIWKSWKLQGFYKMLNITFFDLAKQVDIFANESFPLLWNTIFRKSGGYSFGKKGETLSSALGKNQNLKKLSWLGWCFVVILYIFDYKYWTKGGHCLNSIDK
jgi:hypothetical protein